jgi:hypothetical protein
MLSVTEELLVTSRILVHDEEVIGISCIICGVRDGDCERTTF